MMVMMMMMMMVMVMMMIYVHDDDVDGAVMVIITSSLPSSSLFFLFFLFAAHQLYPSSPPHLIRHCPIRIARVITRSTEVRRLELAIPPAPGFLQTRDAGRILHAAHLYTGMCMCVYECMSVCVCMSVAASAARCLRVAASAAECLPTHTHTLSPLYPSRHTMLLLAYPLCCRPLLHRRRLESAVVKLIAEEIAGGGGECMADD